MKGKHLLSLSLSFFLVGMMLSLNAWAADTYPDKEIRIICSSGAGGGNDRVSRSVQRFLPDVIGTTVLVENRKGAGGKIGLDYFLKQPADGYVLYSYQQPGISGIIKKNPDRFKMDDLAYLNINWTDPTILVARKELGWNSLEDFIQAAKKNPGKYSFAAPTSTTPGSFMPIMLFKKLGLDIKIVQYTSGGEARTSLMGGHTDLTGGGAEGMLSVEDQAVPLGVFWEKPITSWPKAKRINEQLTKYDVKLPVAGSFRLLAVQKEFKEKYPARYEKLVASLKQLITENKEYQDFCDASGVGRDWLGPEETTKIVMDVHETFLNLDLKK